MVAPTGTLCDRIDRRGVHCTSVPHPIVLHNMKRDKRFDQRLAGAIPYLRVGKVLSDVGTDHAHLPIYVCQNGICPRAIASDINRGPVENARRNIAAAGLADRIATVCTPGLDGIREYAPEDITIFGMGGELIAAILAASPWVNREGRRLILQPMTHAEKLREYLLSAGYAIVGETLSREGERIYQTICAEPAPGTIPPSLTPAELSVGQAAYRVNDAGQKELYAALIRRTVRTETAARDARRAAGQDTAELDGLIASLIELEAGL